MRIRVRLFASLRERAGRGEVELELPDGARAADALDALAEVHGGTPVVLAVNRAYAHEDQPLRDGDELALVPPVSGGAAPRVDVQVVEDGPLSLEAAATFVGDPRAGAVVTFTGVTREVAWLDYEAYVEMAREELRRVAEAAVARHGLCAAALHHRTGRVALGQPSVVVAASAPHRGEAFAGARELIDEAKARAPIWKAEEGAWVEGTLPLSEPR